MKSELQNLVEEVKNTRDYENLVELLGKDLGNKLYSLVQLVDEEEK